MTMIAIVGGKGAPGATTTALAMTLAWPLPDDRRVVLVEADPDGGSILAGAMEGRLKGDFGLQHLGLAHRRGMLNEYFYRQLIDLSGGPRRQLLLPGVTHHRLTPSLADTWPPLARLLQGLERQDISHDVLVDLGRSGTYGPSAVLARRADMVLIVARGTLRSVESARHTVDELRRDLDASGTGADALGLCVIRDGRYPPNEVAEALKVPLLMSLPHAVDHARVLSDGGGSLDAKLLRSALMKNTAAGVENILAHVGARRLRLTAPKRAAATGVAGV